MSVASPDLLATIVAATRVRVGAQAERLPPQTVRERVAMASPVRGFRDALARGLVRQATHAAGNIVQHVVRLRGAHTCNGDGRVADHVFEKELRPGLCIELGGPLGNSPVADTREQVSA